MWWIGDIPTWLSFLLAIGIAVAGFVNRNRIGGWLGRVLYRQPPLPVVPAWEVKRLSDTKFILANNGVGIPRAVKMDPERSDVYLISKHGWDEFPPGMEVEIEMQQAVGEPDLGAVISWHVEDRNEPSGWREERWTTELPLNRWW